MNFKQGLKDSPQLSHIVTPEISKENRTKGTLGTPKSLLEEKNQSLVGGISLHQVMYKHSTRIRESVTITWEA